MDTMDTCETVTSFLDMGGILAVVFLFLLRDFYRMKFQEKDSTGP